MRSVLMMLCLMIAIVPAAYAAKIKTTEDLVQAMQKKYATSWYKTVPSSRRPPRLKRTEARKFRFGMKRSLCPALCE